MEMEMEMELACKRDLYCSKRLATQGSKSKEEKCEVGLHTMSALRASHSASSVFVTVTKSRPKNTLRTPAMRSSDLTASYKQAAA